MAAGWRTQSILKRLIFGYKFMHHRPGGQIFSIPRKMYSCFIPALNCRPKNRTTCSPCRGIKHYISVTIIQMIKSDVIVLLENMKRYP